MKLIRDIPDLYCDLIENSLRKPSNDRITVTELVNPPLIKHLQITKWDEIVNKASDYLWMILGSATHQVFEAEGLRRQLEKVLRTTYTDWEVLHKNLEQILALNPSEKMIEVTIKGHKIRGKIDFRETGIIRDFKITSVWSFLGGIKPDWERQQNIYAFMCKMNSHPVGEIYIEAILRDWKLVETFRNKDYPKIPFISLPCKLWSEKEQYDYILSRLAAYDAEPCECSMEEKWQKATAYAVKKPKAKRATRVFNTIDEANEYKDKHEGLEIEIRPAERTRCKFYCPVRSVCPFNKKGK